MCHPKWGETRRQCNVRLRRALQDGSVAPGLATERGEGGRCVGVRAASERRQPNKSTTRLGGSLFAIAQRYDKSLGLRVLDVCAISGAWLLAGLAAFDDRADAAALRNLIWFIGIPVVISMIVNQL